MTIMSGQELVSAAKAGSLDRVSYYLKRRVPADARDEEGYTALYWAACRGHSAICRILLLHNANVNSAAMKSAATPLMACADNNQVACMEGLLRQKSIKIDQRSARGDTALHMGAYRGYTSVVQLLIEHHSNPLIVNNVERTALEEAQTQDEMECVEILSRYMELFKSRLPQRPKVQDYLKESVVSPRKPTESSWTAKEDNSTPVHETHSHTKDLDDHYSHPSYQSIDSAVVLTPPNSIRPHPPSHTSFSSFSCKTSDEDLQLSLDCSMGYAESNAYDCQVNGHTSSSQTSNPSNCHSLRSQLFRMNAISTDSQYNSYSSAPSPKNLSLQDKSTSASLSAENKPVNSLSQITPIDDSTKPLRSAVEKYPSRVNDLSCKHSSGGVKYDNNLLPSSGQSLNILPDGKAQADLNVKSGMNHSSGTSSTYGNLEVVKGVRMSEFIENLQMQLLQYESALRKEQQVNCALQQQIKALKDENIKLKVTMNSLHRAFLQRSSSIKPTASGVLPD